MRPSVDHDLEDIQKEFEGVDLGDARRDARLLSVASRVAASPGTSFPKLVRSIAEREGLYRLLNNDNVKWQAILEPHIKASVERAVSQGMTRVVHDTTDFLFSGDRDDMPSALGDTKGFFGHYALAVSGGDDRTPLGVVGMHPLKRTSPEEKNLNERKRKLRAKPRTEKESHRWESLATETSARFASNDVIHVMDQEADDYVMMASLVEAGLRFVVRGTSKRLLQREGESVGAQLVQAPSVVFRTVPLSKREASRSPKHRKAHPPRAEREAELHIRWTTVEITKPSHAASSTPKLPVHVVEVFEPAPPESETAISWTLFTTENVVDTESATRVVDHYRARWRIEEYFRALKQGCAVQKRQLESYDAMLNALAIFAPIAWRLLLLRSLGQQETQRPANDLFDDDEVEVLAALLKDKKCRPLPRNPTVRDMMLSIAEYGGHIRNNGEPGWITLGRGFEDLVQAVDIWRLATKRQNRR
jgi:hypothetical protein